MNNTQSDPTYPSTSAALPGDATPARDERPGALRGGAILTLQTSQAQRLVKGRGRTAQKPAIIGLLGFATLLRPIWHGARADDPYADWWLINVHAALESAWDAFVAMECEVTDRLQNSQAIEVTPPSSIKPVVVALTFSNPYAFRGARLVARYDALVRTALSARYVGLLTWEESERVVSLGARHVRKAFPRAVGYVFTGITRADIAQGTARAAQARERMGELPEDVLSGTRRAPYAPSARVVAANTLQPSDQPASHASASRQ